MSQAPSRPDQTETAPQPYRDGLAELFQVGLGVARMIGRAADAETALADAAAKASVAGDVSAMASSLAAAIEADRAAAAAAEARQTVVARVQAVADAFARVSRSIRLTVALAERLDRGWARPRASDDRAAMARRQVARTVKDAIGREAEGERAKRLTEALSERLDAMDRENAFENRPVEEVMAIIFRDLGLEPVRMTMRSPLPGIISVAEANEAAAPFTKETVWSASPPPRRPDG